MFENRTQQGVVCTRMRLFGHVNFRERESEQSIKQHIYYLQLDRQLWCNNVHLDDVYL